jgi:hypothetical protein
LEVCTNKEQTPGIKSAWVWLRTTTLFALTGIPILIAGCSTAVYLQSESAFDTKEFAWDQTFNQFAQTALTRHGKALVESQPEDVGEWCKKYSYLGIEARKQFWSDLLMLMSKFESDHDVERTYTESFSDKHGKPVVSRGLLQISLESARGYRCPITQPRTLHDASSNLHCGVQILSQLVSRDNRIAETYFGGFYSVGNGWGGGARYWAVLRDRRKISAMQSYLNATQYCS